MKRRVKKSMRHPTDQETLDLADDDVELSDEELEAVVGGLTRPWQIIGATGPQQAGRR